MERWWQVLQKFQHLESVCKQLQMNLHKNCFSNFLMLIFSPTRTQAKLWSQSTCSLPLLHCDGHTLGGRSTGTVTDYFGNFLQEVKAPLRLACTLLAVQCSGYSLLVCRLILWQSATISLFSSFLLLIFSRSNWRRSMFTIGSLWFNAMSTLCLHAPLPWSSQQWGPVPLPTCALLT